MLKCGIIYIVTVSHKYHWDIAKSVRHQTLTLVCVGSSPAIPANMIH